MSDGAPPVTGETAEPRAGETRSHDEPRSLAEPGIEKVQFEAALPELAKAAFTDPSIRTNPRIPLVRVPELLRSSPRQDRAFPR